MVKITTTLPPKTEFKSFPFEQKSIDEDQGIITGYLSTYSNVDLQGDRVQKGAFSKTVREGKSRMQTRGIIWPMLWMHSADQPIGKVIDAQEDEKGLLITAQLDISMTGNEFNNPKAAMVFSGFKQSYISEMSMGYIAIQKEYDKQGVRNLKECAIVESSACTTLFAANPEAIIPIEGVKSMSQKSIYNEQKEKIGYIDVDEEGNDRYILFDQKSTKFEDAITENKDFNSRYGDMQAEDVLSDWYDLASALKYALIDAFTIGDQPLEDAKQALEQFGPALLAWVQRGIDVNLSDFLAAQMQSQTQSSYYYASRSDMPDFKHYIDQLQKERLGIKKGAAISKATAERIGGNISALKDAAQSHSEMAEQHKALSKAHSLATKTINNVADDLSAIIDQVAYDNDQDEQEEEEAARTGQGNKTKSEPRAHAALTTKQQPDNTTANELAQFQAWLEAKTSK